MDDSPPPRPVTVPLLAALLAGQSIIAVVTVGLYGVFALGSMPVTLTPSRPAEWSQLDAVIIIGGGIAGALLAVPPVAALVALWRRRLRTLLIATSLQVLPASLVVIRSGSSSGLALAAFGWTLAGLAALGLAVAPPTRAWLGSPSWRPPPGLGSPPTR